MDLTTIEDTYQLPTYQKLPLIIVKGQGAWVWDKSGKKYLDFYSGHAVTLVGHCHPKVVKAVERQMKKLTFYSNIVYNEQRAHAAKKLIKIAPDSFSSVFFCNSGTEANETALKLTKMFSSKEEIISFYGSFHGRTDGSLSVTGIESYKNSVKTLEQQVKFAHLGNIDSVRKLISSDTAGIIIEPIQSLAGVYMAKPDFYKKLRKICTQEGIVLIFDEVQTGLGRTGKVFIGEYWDVTPDIITLAKGLAGGLPAGAVLVNKPITDIVQTGDFGSTFGGGPVVCVAISATLDVILKQHLTQNSEILGGKLKKEIIKLSHVVRVSGMGLLLGITLDVLAKEIQLNLLAKGIIVGTSQDPNVIRLLPQLIIGDKEIEFFLSGFKEVLEET